ncbi:MAG TPA: ABC transporter substrate-binding protein [Acidimicrobiales bacterium]|jgi:polar amino acid transport system substrate-binding protein|nr:ABC transporter substrate-binding protein [Acidimicrobiales bacterium]
MTTALVRTARRTAAGATVAALAVTGVVTLAGAAPRPNTHPVATFNAAAAKLVPASIKAKSKSSGLAEAFDATYPPDEFLAANHSTIIGFDADLGNALAITLGLRFKPTNVTFDNILPRLQSGAVDIANSSFTDTVKREKSVNFTDYFVAGEAFYVKHNSSLVLNSLAALCGHSVAVETGTVEQTDATTQNAKCPSNKKISITTYPTQTAANSAVASSRQQAGFADSQVAGYIVTQSKGVFKLAGKAINVAPYGIATSKKTSFDKALLAAMNVLIKNGVYGYILKHWGVSAGAVKAAKINDPTL